MKKKILVIFLIAIIGLIIIYNVFKEKKENILFIIDNDINNIKDIVSKYDKENYNINVYRYDNITYKELIESIKNNDYKVIKNEKIYLNQLISSSQKIIININNSEYFNKCKKSKRIIENYDEIISSNINDLTNIINKISVSNTIIIGNYCKNNKHNQKLNIKNEYISITK